MRTSKLLLCSWVLISFLATPILAEEGAAPTTVRSYPATPPYPASTESHRDIAGLYLLQVPEGWHLVRRAWLGFHRALFTPFGGVQPRQDPPVGLAVSYEFFSPGQALLELPIDVLGPRLVQYLLFDYQRLREDPNTRSLVTGGGVSYFKTSLAGQLRDCDDEVVVRVMFARAGSLVYTVMAWCRASDAATHLPGLEGCMGGFLPTPSDELLSHREEKPLEPFEVAERYEASVVMVTAVSGTSVSSGTGFFVREDGYILTNHHVIWDDATQSPSANIAVLWDESLDLPSRPARLVGAYSGSGLRGQGRWPVDVALLKIDGSGYTPMPLTPLSAVKLGDPVMTMGYPMSFSFKGTSVFVTTGTLTRFNRRIDWGLNSFLIDAKITHGNSGGPAIDCMTGGVFGINTFGVGEGTQEEKYLYGYNGVLPIEVALEKFPQVLCYPSGALDAIDAEDHRELGFVFLARGRSSAARGEFEEAIRLDSGSAAAHVGLAECQSAEKEGNPDETLARAEALVLDESRDLQVLEYLSIVHLNAGRNERCVELSNRVLRHVPGRWATYANRARALARLGRKEEAYRDLALARQNLLDLLPDAYVEWGRAALDLGDLDTARAVLAEAVTKFPGSLDAHIDLADCLVRAGEAAGALAMFAAKEREFRSSPVFFSRWGALLRQTGDPNAFLAYDRAMDLYAEAEATPPFDVAAATGWVHVEKKEAQIAFNAFQAALVQDSTTPRAASVFAGLARALADPVNGQGVAWAHVARALELGPEVPEVKAAAAEIPRADMTMASIVVLSSQLAYPPEIVAALIVAARPPCVLTEAEAKDLVEKGLHPLIAEALLKVSTNVPPQGR